MLVKVSGEQGDRFLCFLIGLISLRDYYPTEEGAEFKPASFATCQLTHLKKKNLSTDEVRDAELKAMLPSTLEQSLFLQGRGDH